MSRFMGPAPCRKAAPNAFFGNPFVALRCSWLNVLEFPFLEGIAATHCDRLGQSALNLRLLATGKSGSQETQHSRGFPEAVPRKPA